MIAVLVAVSVFCGTLAVRRAPLAAVVASHLTGAQEPRVDERRRIVVGPDLPIGAAVGAALFPSSAIVGALLGGGLGHVLGRLRRRSWARAQSRRLGQELSTIADLCALYVLSGDSVVGALRRLTGDARGVAAQEIRALLERVDAGVGFPEAAREAARASVHRDGARFYELLAQAHRSGARLVDALELFAGDRRAAVEREMAVEGGRRALTGYGPILGLMIPTTLVFLMYPTLAGLDALSTTR